METVDVKEHTSTPISDYTNDVIILTTDGDLGNFTGCLNNQTIEPNQKNLIRKGPSLIIPEILQVMDKGLGSIKQKIVRLAI